MNQRDQLAEFHRTISDQLNGRLGESPRFFWALVVVSAGYGYVLWNLRSDQEFADRQIVVTLAAVLSYVAILWASWYLAALGYAFRFLQNCQHCIEHALGWDIYAPSGPILEGESSTRRRAGEVPEGRWLFNAFWLLPGIYQAHVFGLMASLVVVVAAFCWHRFQTGPDCGVIVIGIVAIAIGLGAIFWVNGYYLQKFKRTRRDPGRVALLPL